MLEQLVLTVCLNAEMTEGCTTTNKGEPVNHNRCEWNAVRLANIMPPVFYSTDCVLTAIAQQYTEPKRSVKWSPHK